MKKALLWTVGVLVVAGAVVGLVFAFLEGRKELEREREREKPVRPPERVTRTPDGEIVITLDNETQTRIALGIESLVSATFPAEEVAYGTALEPSSLIKLDGELASAETALAASRAAFNRAQTLRKEDNVPAKVYEAAEAQLRADETRVRVAMQELSNPR